MNAPVDTKRRRETEKQLIRSVRAAARGGGWHVLNGRLACIAQGWVLTFEHRVSLISAETTAELQLKPIEADNIFSDIWSRSGSYRKLPLGKFLRASRSVESCNPIVAFSGIASTVPYNADRIAKDFVCWAEVRRSTFHPPGESWFLDKVREMGRTTSDNPHADELCALIALGRGREARELCEFAMAKYSASSAPTMKPNGGFMDRHGNSFIDSLLARPDLFLGSA